MVPGLRLLLVRVNRAFDFRRVILPPTCSLVLALMALAAATPTSAAPAAFTFLARAVILIRVLHTFRTIGIGTMAPAFRVRTRCRGVDIRTRMLFAPQRAWFRSGGGSAAVSFPIIRMPLPLAAASAVLALAAAFPRFRTLVPPLGMRTARRGNVRGSGLRLRFVRHRPSEPAENLVDNGRGPFVCFRCVDA
jgi:hypothetical protein